MIRRRKIRVWVALIGPTLSFGGCNTQAPTLLLKDDLQVAPKDFDALIKKSRALGFLKDPSDEYDNGCPPNQNFFHFIDKLNAELPGMPAGGRTQPRRALIEGDWERIAEILSTQEKLFTLFKDAPKLRRGYRAKNADPVLDFGRTVRSKGALELLLASAELEAFRGNDSKAITQLQQAVAFTNAMADQPAPTDYVSGRGAQVTVLVSINRIASRLRNSPERLAPYEELVSSWNPKLARERLIRFEVNSFIKRLIVETEEGVYQAALDLWRIKRNASLGSSGSDRPYTPEEEAFVESVTREAMKEKQALPYSTENLKTENSALAVVVSKILSAGLQRLSTSPNAASTVLSSDRFEPKTLSDMFHPLTVGTSLDGPEDLFFTNKALVQTAFRIYRGHANNGYPKDLKGFGTGDKAPLDASGRPLELVKLPVGLSLRSVGLDGQPDPVDRRKDDRMIRLDYDFKKND